MKKCDCYYEKTEIVGWLTPAEPKTVLVSRCYGTKECDVCTCRGDRAKCDFYPEVRKKAFGEDRE